MITIEELLKNVPHRVVLETDSGEMYKREISDVTSDSRECVPHCAFVCMTGINSDGHSYIKGAVKNGAELIVCEKEKSEVVVRELNNYYQDITASGKVAVIETENTRAALSQMCASFYGIDKKCPRLICVTGTNGKTTVSTMICRALNYCGKRAAVLGTLGGYCGGEKYDIGTVTTPDPKLLCRMLSVFADGGAEFVVMEASSHALALDKLVGLGRIELGVFTNLTPEHLDFHRSMEKYAEAKAKLFRNCEKGVFFGDDGNAMRMAAALDDPEKAVFCSLSDKRSDYYAENVHLLGESGAVYTVIHGNSREKKRNGSLSKFESTVVNCNIPGCFSVTNSLLAFAVLCELGISPRTASEALKAQEGVRGRMERVDLPKSADYSVYIDFAHTPDALSKLISSVRGYVRPEQRIVVLFGCGGDRDRSKRSLMGAIASRLADFVIVTSDNCRSEPAEAIISEIMSGFDSSCPHVVVKDRREAIKYAVSNADVGDVILLCGKGHEEYELQGEEKLPFNEREIVFEAAVTRMSLRGK